MIIDGKKIAQDIIEKLKVLPVPKKIFAAVLVDSTSSPQVGSSLGFLKQKEKIAKELGVDFRIYKFPEEIKNDNLRKEVEKIALLKPVGGVIVQLPLPEHLNRHYILNVIPREKDVDVLGERALGAFYAGRNPILPPAVGVVEEILNMGRSDLPNIDDNVRRSDLQKLKVAVVGAGFLIGKPIAVWLIKKCQDLFLLRKGSDLSILKQADLVILGTGQAGLIRPEMVKDNAMIIDFGYSIVNNKISGDFDMSSVIGRKSSVIYTPTPNGAGPILVAKIFENFYNLNKSND